MRAVVISFLAFFISAFCALAQNTDSGYGFSFDEFPIAFDPIEPPNSSEFYEVFKNTEFRNQINPESMEMEQVCVIVLKQVPLQNGDWIPMDEDGRPMIELGDGMTFVTDGDLINMLDPVKCAMLDSDQGLEVAYFQ